MRKRNFLISMLLAVALMLSFTPQVTVGSEITHDTLIDITDEDGSALNVEIDKENSVIYIFRRVGDTTFSGSLNKSKALRLAYYKDSEGNLSKLKVPIKLKDSFRGIEFTPKNKNAIEDLIKTIIRDSTLEKEDSVKVITVDEPTQKEPHAVTAALTAEQKRRNAAIKTAVKELGGTVGGSYYARGTYHGVTGTLRLDRSHTAYRKNQIVFDALATVEAVAAAVSATTKDIRAIFAYLIVNGIQVIASSGEAYNYTIKTTYRKYVDVKDRTPLSIHKEVWGTTVLGKDDNTSVYDATIWRYKDKKIETREYYTSDSPSPKTISYNSKHQTLIAYGCRVYHQIK